MPDLMTTSEVADKLGASPRQIARWVAAGKLVPAQKLGGKTGAYLFHPSAIAHLSAPVEAVKK